MDHKIDKSWWNPIANVNNIYKSTYPVDRSVYSFTVEFPAHKIKESIIKEKCKELDGYVIENVIWGFIENETIYRKTTMAFKTYDAAEAITDWFDSLEVMNKLARS